MVLGEVSQPLPHQLDDLQCKYLWPKQSSKISPSLETKCNNTEALLWKTKRLATPLPLNNRKSGPKWSDSLVRIVLRLCCSPPWDSIHYTTPRNSRFLTCRLQFLTQLTEMPLSISGFGVDTAALAEERTERGAIKLSWQSLWYLASAADRSLTAPKTRSFTCLAIASFLISQVYKMESLNGFASVPGCTVWMKQGDIFGRNILWSLRHICRGSWPPNPCNLRPWLPPWIVDRVPPPVPALLPRLHFIPPFTCGTCDTIVFSLTFIGTRWKLWTLVIFHQVLYQHAAGMVSNKTFCFEFLIV